MLIFLIFCKNSKKKYAWQNNINLKVEHCNFLNKQNNKVADYSLFVRKWVHIFKKNQNTIIKFESFQLCFMGTIQFFNPPIQSNPINDDFTVIFNVRLCT